MAPSNSPGGGGLCCTRIPCCWSSATINECYVRTFQNVEASPSPPPGDLGGLYSVLKLFTGFAIAALIAVYPTVIQAINNDPKMVATKNHIPIMIR